MYSVISGTSKKNTKSYAVIGGVAKNVAKIYNVIGGVTKLAWSSVIKSIYDGSRIMLNYTNTLNSYEYLYNYTINSDNTVTQKQQLLSFPDEYTADYAISYSKDRSKMVLIDKQNQYASGSYYDYTLSLYLYSESAGTYSKSKTLTVRAAVVNGIYQVYFTSSDTILLFIKNYSTNKLNCQVIDGTTLTVIKTVTSTVGGSFENITCSEDGTVFAAYSSSKIYMYKFSSDFSSISSYPSITVGANVNKPYLTSDGKLLITSYLDSDNYFNLRIYLVNDNNTTTVLLDKYTGYNEAVQNICESSDKNYIYISTATGWDSNTDTRSLTFITVQRTSTTTVSSNLLYTHTSYSSGDANGYKAGGLLCLIANDTKGIIHDMTGIHLCSMNFSSTRKVSYTILKSIKTHSNSNINVTKVSAVG